MQFKKKPHSLTFPIKKKKDPSQYLDAHVIFFSPSRTVPPFLLFIVQFHFQGTNKLLIYISGASVILS